MCAGSTLPRVARTRRISEWPKWPAECDAHILLARYM